MSDTLAGYPDVLKPGEFAEALRKGRNFPYEEIREGRLRAIRLGKRTLRIPKSELLRYLELDQLTGGPDAAVAD